MTEISKEVKRPSLQKRVFTFSKSSPSEIVRSKLSATEISHRALTYLPDEILKDIPENETTYSLFEGFQASVDAKKDNRHKDASFLIEDMGSGAAGVSHLSKERNDMNKRLDHLGIRKNIASSEIREIDHKIAQLTNIRGLVLERLAQLEQDESQLEHQRETTFPLHFITRRSYSNNSNYDSARDR